MPWNSWRESLPSPWRAAFLRAAGDRAGDTIFGSGFARVFGWRLPLCCHAPEVATDVWRVRRRPGALREQDADEVIGGVAIPGRPEAAVHPERSRRAPEFVGLRDDSHAESPSMAVEIIRDPVCVGFVRRCEVVGGHCRN